MVDKYCYLLYARPTIFNTIEILETFQSLRLDSIREISTVADELNRQGYDVYVLVWHHCYFRFQPSRYERDGAYKAKIIGNIQGVFRCDFD